MFGQREEVFVYRQKEFENVGGFSGHIKDFIFPWYFACESPRISGLYGNSKYEEKIISPNLKDLVRCIKSVYQDYEGEGLFLYTKLNDTSSGNFSPYLRSLVGKNVHKRKGLNHSQISSLVSRLNREGLNSVRGKPIFARDYT